MKMLCFEFNHNRTINEEFDFFEKGGGVGSEVLLGGFIDFYLNHYW